MPIHARTLIFAVTALALGTADAAPKKGKTSPKQEAAGHVEKAMKAHSEEKFDVALVELQAAYKLDPQPDLLFAIGQVHVKLGDCKAAIESYEKFLAQTKDAQAKAVTNQAIDACKKELATATPKPDPVPDPVPTPDPTPTPDPQPPVRESPFQERAATPVPQVNERPAERTPWYKDPIGDTLVIGGTLAVVGGIVMYSGARADLDDAEAAPTHADYQTLVDDAKSKRTFSVVLLGGGAALVGAGIIRYVLRGGGSSSRQVGVVPARGGGFVSFGGSF